MHMYGGEIIPIIRSSLPILTLLLFYFFLYIYTPLDPVKLVMSYPETTIKCRPSTSLTLFIYSCAAEIRTRSYW